MKTWRVLFSASLLALAGAVCAAPPARVAPYEVDRSSIGLGEPLQLRLTREWPPGAAEPAPLDLGALERDFEILERTVGRDSRHETLTLTLYARRTGRFVLAVPGVTGRAPQIMVSEGSERIPRVHWKLSLDPATPQMRQPTTFTLEACDDGTLLWKRPVIPAAEGVLLRPLNETEIITTREGQRCTAHRWHWSLLPTATGPLQLPLPVVEAGKFGTRLRFAPPALAFEAQPLPAWLPAEVAVGQPEFSAEPLPAQLALNQPQPWRLRVVGAYSAAALQQLLALQLRGSDARLGLGSYAPQIESMPSMQAAAQWRITLYLRPLERGRFDLPALQWPWYETATGQVRHAVLAPASVEVVDLGRERWMRVAMWLPAVAMAALLAVLAGWMVRWRLQRRRLRRAVQQAATISALRHALLAHGCGDAPVLTLQAWQQTVAARWRSQGLEALVQTLDQASYGAEVQEEVPQALRAQALAWVKSLRPVRGWWRRR